MVEAEPDFVRECADAGRPLPCVLFEALLGSR